MKYIIFFGSFAGLFSNCTFNSKEVPSVFMLKPQSKRLLLGSGFSHPRLKPMDTVGVAFDKPAVDRINEMMEQGNQDIFTMKKGDTTITYRFRKESLEYIYIQVPMAKVDTTKLFNLLNNLGFMRTKVADTSFEEFVNNEEHIQYEMAFSKRIVLFTNNVGSKAEGTTPTIDSVSGRR